MIIRIKKVHESAIIPRYAHGPNEDAGMDLHAIEEVILRPNIPTLVKTGLSIELPPGVEAQIRPRSGMALKHGITVVNSPGTVDPGWRGEIGVILQWCGHNPTGRWCIPFDVYYGQYYLASAPLAAGRYMDLKDPELNTMFSESGAYRIIRGDRIAQMVVAAYVAVEWEVAELSDSVRGEGGFGSSGR